MYATQNTGFKNTNDKVTTASILRYSRSNLDDQYIKVFINPLAATYCASIVKFPETAQQ